MPFAKKIITWYIENGRSLPWRTTSDPYAIWLSEIILQQTRVAQGIDYYYRFLERFPTVAHLAEAPIDEVMRLWQGLGYYSRARNLHTAAKQIIEQGDTFPCTYEGIRSLKGVGDYTAAAIASFAFGLPHAAIDGNAYRVLSRHFDIDTPIDTAAGKAIFRQLANELLPIKSPALFNQAIMDLGATICTPAAVRCEECPLADSCLSLANNTVSKRPVKQKKLQVRTRHFAFIIIKSGTHLLLQQRKEKDIWQGLYQPPMHEFDHCPSAADIMQIDIVHRHLSEGGTLQLIAEDLHHQLTHQLLKASAYTIEMPHLTQAPIGFILIPHEDIRLYGLPRLVEKIFQLCFKVASH